MNITKNHAYYAFLGMLVALHYTLGCFIIATFQQKNSPYPHVSLLGIYKPDPKAFFPQVITRGLNHLVKNRVIMVIILW